MNLCTYKVMIGREHHTISTLVINPNLVQQHIVDAYKSVRANTIMVCEPKPHTPTSNGVDTYTTSKTLLNSSGFNSTKFQSALACEAINSIQSVAYNIRTNLTTAILEQYKSEDKWFNEKGQFMTAEWSKLVADIKLASNQPFYFAVACDDRSRMYELSAYIKYQGDKFRNLCLSLLISKYVQMKGLHS